MVLKQFRMEEVQENNEIKPPTVHKLVKYFPQFTLKVLHVVVKYTLKYLLLILTLLAECRRVYYFSTKQFSGGLGYDYEQDMGNLSKLPRHMSFVINEDVTTDYCDIANLIVWTIAMGIPYISLYDRHGKPFFRFLFITSKVFFRNRHHNRPFRN